MRVYVGTTLGGLRGLHETGSLPAPVRACAVTPALIEWYAESDAEELEYAALHAATRAALLQIYENPAEPRRAVVVAEVPDDAAIPDPGSSRAAVTVGQPIALADVDAIHLDDPAAVDAVLAAAAALTAAERGDDDAQFALDAADDWELMWFATQELPDLL